MADGTPVFDQVVRFNRGRKAKRVREKLRRMAQGPFAFFRGSDHLFARAWRALRPADPGPTTLSCADLHVENFGAYRTADGDYRYDINDFDEAAVLCCGYDLTRCATSLLLAAAVWGHSASDAADLVEEYLAGYQQAVTQAAETGVLGEIAPGSGRGPIWDLLGTATLGTQGGLLDHYTERRRSGRRHLRRVPGKLEDIRPRRAAEVARAVERHGRKVGQAQEYRVLDVTARIAGVGSLGVRRYAVLVAGGGSPDANRLLDVKEALPSSVVGHAAGPQPHFDTEAERVVWAQRRLQGRTAAGLGTLRIGRRWYRVREIVPQEHRCSIDRLREHRHRLRRTVQVMGWLTAWSHVRGHPSDHVPGMPALLAWANQSSLQAVRASAERYAKQVGRDYQEYRAGYNGTPRR